MVFSPGRSFSRASEQDAMISCIMMVEVRAGNEETGRLGTYRATLLTDRDKRLSFEGPWFPERLTFKNELKQALYRILPVLTGKKLPWGTLTGIYSAKFTLNLLQRSKTAKGTHAESRRNFFLSNAKNALCVKTAENELRAIRGLDFTTGYGFYIGISFCPTICLYCSFPSYPAGKSRVASYLVAFREELCLTAEMMAGRCLGAVYVDDGTPTNFTTEEFHLLFSLVCETFDFSAHREFTVEAGRPDSITREKPLMLWEVGADRTSINPQALKQTTLDLIGRFHTVEQFTGNFTLAGELGSDNIDIDLIMGLPNETEADVRRTTEGICTLSPNDVTIHSLVLRRAARLNTKHEDYRDVRYGDANQMVELATSYCKEMGFSSYYLYRQKNMAGNLENVGWCRPGKEGLHNILIIGEPEIIVGCGVDTTARVMHGERQYGRLEDVKGPMLYVERLPELLTKKQRVPTRDTLG